MTGSADQIEAQAADFLVRRMEGDWSGADQQELDLWLTQSMSHRAAFWRLEFGAAKIDRLLDDHQADSDAHDSSRPSGPRIVWWKIAASVIFALGIFGSYYGIDRIFPGAQPKSVEYATNFGGISTAVLPDNSQLTLNSATAVRFEETHDQRVLWLKSGEAFFNVAHDTNRPFVVHSGDQSITVVGTRFSVEKQGDRTVVTVLEGKVRTGEGDGIMLIRGQTAVLSASSALVTTVAPDVLERRLSWRSGMLVFADTPIREAAAAFNRYNERKIIIADAGVGDTRIGGSFNLANEGQFVDILRSAYGFRVDAAGSEIRISSR